MAKERRPEEGETPELVVVPELPGGEEASDYDDDRDTDVEEVPPTGMKPEEEEGIPQRRDPREEELGRAGTTIEMQAVELHERPGISIGVKLIAVSMLLLIVVIGLFGVMNAVQSKRIISDASARLEQSINKSLNRAGQAQLQLLAEATRIALGQSDYTTLQSIMYNLKKRDDLVTEAAVVDPKGVVLAHSDPRQKETKAKGLVREIMGLKEMKVKSGVIAGEQSSIMFATPVNLAGARLCTVMLAYSLRPLEAALSRAEQTKQAEISANLRSSLIVGLLAVALGVALSILQALRISRPIRALARQADQIAGGDLKARAEVRSRDEIGLLGNRFNYMAEQVLLLMQETKEKATMEKEFEVASAIQTTLVPEAKEVDLSGIKLAAFFKPAAKCGGDWWSYYKLSDGRVVIMIGDVTGHGIASAMITAVVKGAASNMVSVVQDRLDLSTLLLELDTTVHEAARGKFAMTCFASIFDPSDRTLSFANAGHTFPLLQRKDAKRLMPLVARGNRLGDMAGECYEVQRIQLEPDDFIVWFTDGIVEGENLRGDEFGEKRFRAIIRNNAQLAPGDARDQIVGRAYQFYEGIQQEDDITIVIGKVR